MIPIISPKKDSKEELLKAHKAIRAKKELANYLLAIYSNAETRASLPNTGLCYVIEHKIEKLNSGFKPFDSASLYQAVRELILSWPTGKGFTVYPVPATDFKNRAEQYNKAQGLGTLYDHSTEYGRLRLELALYISEQLARQAEQEELELAKKCLKERGQAL